MVWGIKCGQVAVRFFHHPDPKKLLMWSVVFVMASAWVSFNL